MDERTHKKSGTHVPDFELRPVEREDGWNALTADGYGHLLGYKTEREVEIWLDGYRTGASENM